MLKVNRAELTTSAVKKGQYPEELPSIVLFGRSNAGKSSLINVLLRRKNLARTSSAPGKTRLINFYKAEGPLDETRVAWYFVDLPGYGYAKVARGERERWLDMIDEFLDDRNPGRCWQLVDIRHEPSKEDVAMHQALVEGGYNVTVVANKIDKVSKNARAASLKVIAAAMKVNKADIIPFSAITGEGADALLAHTEAFLREELNLLEESADSPEANEL